ncbi:group II trans-sialidase superfamily [Trypanosoma rangeli]|uniref:Group II trans-sialidase superfamily n=1 Tax=Trypanosoma rangeli TaxID=5698 RepID=A0A422MQD9_TRYRA|nr:group II trans-sialidase superfamily [Trypanosoma rangeli]RNE95419.1 group II trans-sialidase superfamily [Trypanosoma rangeli]|eukprot:RNE95419.1 group II trans-sialidase superfamily [Trypanosoma rangeli]
MFLYSVQLLFCVLLVCCGGTAVYGEEGNTPKEAQTPEAVDLFVPRQTIVETQGQSQTRDSFAHPSLASAGGVLVALAEGNIFFQHPRNNQTLVTCADVVAGYIDPAENWSSFVAEVSANEWKAHSIFNATTQEEHNDRVIYEVRPTTIAKGNKVFLLVGGYHQKYDPSSKKWTASSQDLDLLVGEAMQDKVIQWGEPTSLVPQIKPSAKQRGLEQFVGGGGSGVVMEDGTLVFPVTARMTGDNETVSMIIYSKDDGKNWTLSHGMLPVGCTDPLIVEWEQGQLVMVAKCDLLSNVFESRDMGATWREAVRTLTRVQPRFSPQLLQRVWTVASLTTATIAEKKVMLYTQKGAYFEETVTYKLYLWVADNNRTFHLGPISIDTAVEVASDNALLQSNDALHLLQVKGNDRASSLFFTSLPEQLKTITSVLETWAEMDSYLSELSVPTAGLVGFLSGASGEGTWSDAYRCLNATVANATKVEDGFKFTGSESYAMWPVNMWKHHYVDSFVDYEFALVATVTIDEVPNESVPLLGAGLEDNENTKFVGLLYTTEKRWGTVFNGMTTTTHNSTWEPGKEYKVALMLEGNKGSVYVDGVLVGSSDTLPTPESRRHDISHFYFGGGKNSSVTVRNVFLYNRPLNAMELKKVDGSDASEQRTVNSFNASEDGAGGSFDTFEQRTVSRSKASEQSTVDSSKASEQSTADGSTRADVFWVSILLLLGQWGFAALC